MYNFTIICMQNALNLSKFTCVWQIFCLLTWLRLLFAAVCWHFNETTNVTNPYHLLESQQTETWPGKPQTLFLFCLSPVQWFLLQFSNFIADATVELLFQRAVCRRLLFMGATTDKNNNKGDGKLLLRLHMCVDVKNLFYCCHISLPLRAPFTSRINSHFHLNFKRISKLSKQKCWQFFKTNKHFNAEGFDIPKNRSYWNWFSSIDILPNERIYMRRSVATK